MRLDYDRHEQTAPAAYAAQMMLFNAVTDASEYSAESESHWLDAAVEAMSSASGWGESEMRRVLLVIRQDYVIEPQEGRTIEGAVATVAERDELRDAERARRGGDIHAPAPADVPGGTRVDWSLSPLPRAEGRRHAPQGRFAVARQGACSYS